MCSPRARSSVRSVSALDKTEKLRDTGKGKTRRPAPRRLVQLYAALLYNANLKGFIDGHIYSGDLKAACVPGLNCYSCPGAVAGCPLGALQNALGAAGHTAPWYVLGILALFGVILGRIVCGWLCPLGLIQELLHKIPTPKIRKSRFTRALSWLKYVFLAVFVLALPLYYGIANGMILPAFCKYICPAGTLEGAVGLLQNPANSSSFFQLRALFTGKWVIMAVIGLACVFCYRSFCRFICPLGALYSFFNRFALTGVKVNPDRCVGCGRCVMNCRMDVRHVGDRECISCGKCIDACSQGAISLKCGSITLKGPEIGPGADPEPVIRKRKKIGRMVWCAALAVLVFAVAWFNLIEPALGRANPGSAAVSVPETEAAGSEVPSLPVGTEPGCLAPDFAAELLSGETFRLSEHRGRVVILNFWSTTCAPCIEELPFFEQLKTAYPDAEILAVHHRAGASGAEAFLADKGWDHLDFALDSREKGILPLLNASDALPQTIILNKQGVVTYNAQAPLTYDRLEQLYLAALADQTGAESAAPAGTAAPEPAADPSEAPLPAADAGNEPEKASYTVTVTDQDGRPVPGVILSFCTDTACRNSEPSDEDGKVAMTLEPDRYHLQVADLPEEYEVPGETDLFIGPDSGEETLVITRKDAAPTAEASAAETVPTADASGTEAAPAAEDNAAEAVPAAEENRTEAAPAAEDNGTSAASPQPTRASRMAPEELLGQPFPDFTFTDTEGETFTLSKALEEKEVVFISIFASWCGPCRDEFPEMEKVYQKYGDKMAYFALSGFANDTMDIMRDYKAEMNLSFRFGLEKGTGIMDLVKIDGYPTNFVIDRFGNTGYARAGSIPSEEDFERLVTAFMGEAYTATVPLTEIPGPAMDVPYPEDSALSAAVNAEGSSLAFSSDPEGKNFPFLPETRDGQTAVCASNTGRNTQASMHTSLSAEEGSVLAFRVGGETWNFSQLLTVYVDGNAVRKFCGSYDWKTVFLPLEAGEHEISFRAYRRSQPGEDEWMGIREVRLLNGDEAAAALESVPAYPRSAENSLEILNAGVREAVLLYKGNPFSILYVANDEVVQAGATITEKSDPDLALLVAGPIEIQAHVADLPFVDGYFRFEFEVPPEGFASVEFAPDLSDPDVQTLTCMCVREERNISTVLDLYLPQVGPEGAKDLSWKYLDEYQQETAETGAPES